MGFKYRAIIRAGGAMETILSDLTVSMSVFKKNPAKVIREAGKKPVAVLNHNKAAFYMIAPDVYEDLLESVYDRDIESLIQARRTQIADAIEVDIDKL
jgi:antitoxin StbD